MANNKENVSKQVFKLKIVHGSNVEAKLLKNDIDKAMQTLKEFVSKENLELKDMITKQNQQIIEIQAENAALLKQLIRKETYMPPDQIFGRFPLNSKDELQQLEQGIKEQEENVVTALKRIILPGGLMKNLNRIFGVKIITDFYYDGVRQKEAIKNYKNLMDALFKALQKDGYVKEDLQKDIRKSFKLHKNRHFKSVCIQKKKEKSKSVAIGGNADIPLLEKSSIGEERIPEQI